MANGEREVWNSRTAFILAAIGSAVGLGNVWRFPFIAYDNGGGAFLIPYFIALFTAGIPLMMLELSMGHKMRAGAPMAFSGADKKWSWVGWWTILLSFVAIIYYTVIMAWATVYIWHSASAAWGDNAPGFFHDTLGVTGGPGELGGIQWPIVLGLAITWIMIYWIVSKGVQRVGKVVLITVPLPIILLIILVIRGVTLPGASDGINYYLTPDMSEITNASVWLAAYGQIFFTLSLAQGVMIAYASYLPKKSDITNNALIISLANCGTSFFAGFAVFSVIGFLAHEQGVAVTEVVAGGTGLAFETYPTAISLLPFGVALFGVIFFVMLITLGIDSAFSIVEAINVGFVDAGFNKDRTLKIICIFGFLMGLIFTTGSGKYWIHIFDYFVTSYGLVLAGALEAIVIGYFYGAKRMRTYMNSVSEVEIGEWWDYAIKYMIPLALIIVTVYSLYEILSGNTGNAGVKELLHFPRWTVYVGAMGAIISTFFASFYMMRWDKPPRPEMEHDDEDDIVEEVA